MIRITTFPLRKNATVAHTPKKPKKIVPKNAIVFSSFMPASFRLHKGNGFFRG
jgi:hypothetical protein